MFEGELILNRPYFHHLGRELEEEVKRLWNDKSQLRIVLQELKLRSTSKMKKLRSKVEGRINVLGNQTSTLPHRQAEEIPTQDQSQNHHAHAFLVRRARRIYRDCAHQVSGQTAHRQLYRYRARRSAGQHRGAVPRHRILTSIS